MGFFLACKSNQRVRIQSLKLQNGEYTCRSKQVNEMNLDHTFVDQKKSRLQTNLADQFGVARIVAQTVECRFDFEL